MEKPVRSSFQYLSISYECALAIGNSLNLSEMLQEVIHTVVHKTNAHRGIIWVKNGEQELKPVANAGIKIEDVLAQGEIMDLRDILNQILKRQQFVLRYKDDKDFLQYCPVLTGKEECVLIVPVTNVAILHLIYASREIADEPLANLLTSLSKKLGVAIEACMTHDNVIKEIQVRKKAENELTKKTEQLVSSQKELQGLYGESEQARKSLLSILEDVTQKEEALKESEVRFRTIFDSINDAVFIHDMETGAILDVNRTMCDIYGYSREEVDQLDIQALSSGEVPYTQQDALEWIKKAAMGEAQVFEWMAKHKSGHPFWVEISMKKAVIGPQERLLVVVRDITERKHAEETLKESEDRYRTIFETTGNAMLIGEEDTTISMINAEFEKLCGYSKEEVEGKKSWMEFAVKADMEKIKECHRLRMIDPNAAPPYYETQLIDKKGTVKNCFLTINLIPITKKTVVSLIDITERKQVEDALERSEAFLNETGQMAKVGGWELDAETREVRWTEETYRIHEIPLDYKPPLDGAINFYHPEDRPKLEHAIRRALEHGEPYNLEIRFTTARGKHLWAHTTCKPHIVDGKTVKLTGTFQDITERKAAEDALKEAELKYRTLVNNIPAVTYVAAIDKASTTLYISPQIETILGISPDTYKDDPDFWREHLHPDDRERVLAEVTRSHNSNETFISEYRMFSSDGSQVWLHDEAKIVEDDEENQLYLQGVMTDITERRKSEEELILFNEMAVDRELKMVELKKEMNSLLEELGREPRYKIPEQHNTWAGK